MTEPTPAARSTRDPSLLSRIGRVLDRTRVVLSNLIFFGVLIVVLLLVFSAAPVPEVPERGALVINPRGAVVEQLTPMDPLQQWLTPAVALAETRLNDLLTALRHAAEDERIPLVVLNLDELQIVSVAHANAIGEALGRFREAGKEVIAYGSYFGQQHYLIASYADALYMHPMGQVALPGFSIRQMYFKELIDKLDVKVHVFRVGRYKEFVEPYTRADMSEEAREANLAVVDTLWQGYADQVQRNRQLETVAFDRYTQSFAAAAEETRGDFARLAIEYHLVDELLTPDQARVRVADKVGRDRNGDFSGIGFREYLQAVNGAPAARGRPQVAVLTGQGPVVMGNQPRGVIAADHMIQSIRALREDDQVGALVVRLNTPGGSAFASELIRQELELTQVAGKPVVVSMGPLAASGGYWISATADAIVAEPTTLTGSIGVFGILPTFEDTLASIGVTSDGVQTSPLTNPDPFSPLSPATEQVLQAGTEHTYQRFVNLVARGRDLTPERVDEIAQGRVWLGSQALQLGLVDDLGDEQAAIDRAAALASLTDFGVKRIEAPLSARELLLRQLLGNVSGHGPSGGIDDRNGHLSPLLRRAQDAWQMLTRLNDPGHSYALCLSCDLSAGSSAW